MAGDRPSTRSEKADRHELYALSVQAPESEVDFVSRSYQRLRKRTPMRLREDFCGTAVFSLAWVQSRAGRTAVGVDLDWKTLQWGLDHRIGPAGQEVRSRVELRKADVREPTRPRVEVAVAFNASYWCFETRDALKGYFEAARAGLIQGGILYLDAFGGTANQVAGTCTRKVFHDDPVVNGGKAFTYEWEQVAFNPITAHMDCAIHFAFQDGSRLDRAFTYSWRVWTLPEILELLLEAGFSKVRFWAESALWTGTPPAKSSFREVREIDNGVPIWWIYITAENGRPKKKPTKTAETKAKTAGAQGA